MITLIHPHPEARSWGARTRPAPVLCATLISVALMLVFAEPASAASHQWRFSEFYSSPDGAIQFIEMQEIVGADNEVMIKDHWYATNTYNLDHSETLGADLPPGGTAKMQFLVGTESYAALPGVPAPDYVVPDGVIDPGGDTIVWWFYQTLTIPVDTMPSDGVLSLHVTTPAMPSNGFTVGANSPTNFAKESGTVVLAPLVPAARGWAYFAIAALLLAAGAALMRVRATGDSDHLRQP